MTQENTSFSDETLTAYLDGELDATETQAIDDTLVYDTVLAARLATLSFPMDSLRKVMAPDVLRAPSLPAEFQTTPVPDVAGRSAPARPRYFAPLMFAATFLVGMVTTTLIQPAQEPQPFEKMGWTAAIASYQALYVTETLSGNTQDQSVTDAVLARAAAEFNVPLEPALQVDSVEFKRAQMLGFKGKPLLQMAYLRADGEPFALCVISVDKPDRGPKDEFLFDLAGVSWVKDGVGYFLIGGDDPSKVQDLSSEFIARL